MLQNIKEYLANHPGLNFFGVFPIVLFSIIMILVLIYIFGVSDKHIDELKNYPLNDQNDKDYGKNE